MEQQQNKVAITFKGYKINNVIFIADEKADDSNREIEVQLGIDPCIINEKEFSVTFKLVVTDELNKLSIEMSAIAFFATADSIVEDFKDSNFVRINAPAIVFPYLRAYISNLTVGAGFSPIVLPTLNFTSN